MIEFNKECGCTACRLNAGEPEDLIKELRNRVRELERQNGDLLRDHAVAVNPADVGSILMKLKRCEDRLKRSLQYSRYSTLTAFICICVLVGFIIGTTV